MGVRIKDIAKASGVSPAAVSLVLNNRPGVGESTRKKILGIARAMEYDAEKTSNLARSKSETIRFLRITRHGHVVNSDHSVFIANYIDGMGLAARELGLNLEVAAIDYGSIDAVAESAQASWVGGTIILGTELSREDLKSLEALKVPLVVIDNYDELISLDFVDMNNRESVRAAVGYLNDRGHRHIGLVTSDVATANFQMRAGAFRDSLEPLGIEFRKEFLYQVDSTFSGAYQDMASQLAAREKLPTAFFCVNDIMAFGVMKALKERGVRIPEDVSIIGFDNLPSAALSDPPLTSVDVSKVQIGRTAVRILFDRMSSKSSAPALKILVSGRLVERSSVRDANSTQA